MIVRPLLATDLPQLGALARAVHRSDGYPPHLESEEVPGYVAAGDVLAAWVAVDDQQVVGHVALHPADSADGIEVAVASLDRRPSDLGAVSRLLVDPTLRRSGVGRRLLDEVTNDCRRRGLVPILEVVDRFEPAIGLYEGAGWRRLGKVDLELRDGSDLRLLVFVAPDPGGGHGAGNPSDH